MEYNHGNGTEEEKNIKKNYINIKSNKVNQLLTI
jgi:hypothetical protein